MEFNPIALFVFLCGILSAAIALYVWRHRSAQGAQAFAGFMLFMTVYILGYSFELASSDAADMLFWSKFQYIGIVIFPTLYLIFVIQYSGFEQWLTRTRTALLFLLPLAFLWVKFNDAELRLIYATAGVDTSGAIPLLSFTRGPLYLVIVVYNLLAVTVGNFLLVQKRRFSSALFRRQTTLILAAALIIYPMYGFYLSGIQLFPTLKQLDINPFIYTLWGGAVALTMFRHRLFDLAPIARDALIEILSDGVVVLDAQGRVVDANPAALKIFGWKEPPVGQPAEQMLHHWISPALLNQGNRTPQQETQLTRGSITAYYEMDIAPLKRNQGQRVGSLVVLHNITDRKTVEKKLQELSLVDELTQLTNRRGFRLLAHQLLHMVQRMQLNAVLFYIDLDRLKWINDSLGHAAGDQALIETALILKQTFRASDILARFGGDEFVVLTIESGDYSSSRMLARLQEQLETHNRQPERSYVLSFSVGLAIFNGDQPIPMEQLLNAADQAMYQVKQAKKDAANPQHPLL